jgi:hypothetical protein
MIELIHEFLAHQFWLLALHNSFLFFETNIVVHSYVTKFNASSVHNMQVNLMVFITLI